MGIASFPQGKTPMVGKPQPTKSAGGPKGPQAALAKGAKVVGNTGSSIAHNVASAPKSMPKPK